jgi:pimeloyl-ACP methyl ester carboxylesterase
MLDDLERVLDTFAPGAIAVAGHSMGGALAQHWALRRPERVTALVLSSSFARVTDPPANWYGRYLEQPLVVASQRLLSPRTALALARWFARRGAWVYDRRCDDRLLGFVRFCMRDCPAAYVRSALRLLAAHDTRGALAGLRCPTLVLVGERESPFARPAADELHRLIVGSEFAVSPDASHLHPLSHPEWVAETITRWLDRRLRP